MKCFHRECTVLAGCTRCTDNLDAVICNSCRLPAPVSASAVAGAGARASFNGEQMVAQPAFDAYALGSSSFPLTNLEGAAELPAPQEMRSLLDNLATLFKSGTDKLRESISSLQQQMNGFNSLLGSRGREIATIKNNFVAWATKLC